MENPDQILIIWSDYMEYRIKLRCFDIKKVEYILRYSDERYFDTITQRNIAIGRHDKLLAMIPYERTVDKIYPITIHVTTRQQINFRLKTGRFIYG